MDETPKSGEDQTPAAVKTTPPRPERGAHENARRDSPPRPPAVVLPALLVSLAVVTALGVGAAAMPALWMPKLKALVAAPDPRVAGLEARVKALEERAGESPRALNDAPLSGRPPVLAPAPGAGLEARVKALEERSPASPPVSADLPVPVQATSPGVDKAAHDELVRRLGESETRAADLARRLGLIESADAKPARPDAALPALVLAVGQLRDAAGAGRPFVRELESLRALAKDRREVAEAAERLAPLAARGVPTVSALKERFDGTARAVMIAARSEGGGDWTDRALARLSSLIAVRRTDDRAAEGTPDAALRAAEQALGQADVAQAAAALEKLSGPAQAAAKGWLADARARAFLDATLADLHRRAVKALAGGG